MKDIIVYTAIFGNYDNLIELDDHLSFDNVDYYCFTDNMDIKSKTWKLIYINNDNNCPILKNRQVKILGNDIVRKYQYNIYVDANIAFLKDPELLVEKYLKCDDVLFLPKHPKRNCLYKEAVECIVWGKCTYSQGVNVIGKMRKNNFPKHFGLAENNIILRRNDERTNVIMNRWWDDYKNNPTKRDQLSLGYVIWKSGEKFNYIEEHSRDNVFFSLSLHNEIKNRNNLKKISMKIKREVKKIIVPLIIKC